MRKPILIVGMRLRSFTWVDWLLLAAMVGLSIPLLVTILESAIDAWRNRPRPGRQVCQQYVADISSQGGSVATQVGYLLYLPREYTTSHKWPLVVFLHGAGERGENVERVRRVGLPSRMEQGEDGGFILLSPQCPAESGWSPELAVSLIEHISRTLSVDRDRVYLTGYSMGGFGAWETSCYDPDRFAALVPLCGGGDESRTERLVHLPIWVFHGAKDKVVPLEASSTMVDAVKKCGGDVQFTVYPESGHDICGATYQDQRLYTWLLAQRRGGRHD